MPTVQQLAAQINRQVAAGLARTAQAMPAEKQTWQPLEQGRSALSQIQECVVTNGLTTQVLQSRVVPEISREIFGQKMAEIPTMETAIAALAVAAEELAAAIEAFPDAHLDDLITLPIGGGMEMSFAQLMLLSYWNMSYHVGQTNYIQTLYGDMDMH